MVFLISSAYEFQGEPLLQRVWCHSMLLARYDFRRYIILSKLHESETKELLWDRVEVAVLPYLINFISKQNMFKTTRYYPYVTVREKEQ